METITSLAGAASNAIWGSAQTADVEEPVSGKQGAGTVSEPFDKGNEEQATTASSGVIPASTSGSNPNNAPPTTAGLDSSNNRGGPSEAQSSDVTGDPSSGVKPEEHHQGAGKPADKPSGDAETKIPTGKDGKPEMPHTDSQREALVIKGEFPHDPNDHSGEPLKMHDGADKKDSSAVAKDDPREDGKKDRSASVSQEGGQPQGKGTGEKVVKASGLAADGGDFDASNPGAGQEATRIAEEKGIKSDHKPPAPPGESASPAAAKTTGTTEKVSKLDKIKGKLHIGSGKNLDK